MVHLVSGRGTSSSHIFAVVRKAPSLPKGNRLYSDSLHDLHDIHLSSPIIVKYMEKNQYSKHPLMRTCGLKTCWQKFGTLIPKNVKTCLPKQNQAGSQMWVTGTLW